MKTKIILINYLRQLEKIYDDISIQLPNEMEKTKKNIFNKEFGYFPILENLDEFIENLKEDIKEFNKEVG